MAGSRLLVFTMGMDRAAAFRALSRPGRRLQGVHSTRGVGAAPDRADASPRDNPHTPPTSMAGAHESRGQGSLTTPPPIDVEAIRRSLRDWGVLASTSLRQRVDHFSKTATTSFSHLGMHLNQATGYQEIEALKRQVVEQEARIKTTRRAAAEAKTAYDDAVLQRSISQRQVNDLLQRKSSWSDTDVSNFTSLVRSDHSFEQEEARAKERVTETEDAVEREFSELMRVILARYHEEQVWSDKIRSVSTYGSLAVVGVNLVVFVMAIVVVEPWKRKKLAQTFERKVDQVGAETKVLMGANAARLEERLSEHEKLLTELITQVSSEARQAMTVASSEEPPVVASPPSSWWSRAHLSYLGVVAGSAVAGGVITSIFFAK